MNGKYLYDMAFKAVDYCGNIERGTSYSEYFSPNNIRRLIISPDAVASEFYIPVPNVGRGKTVRLPSGVLSTIESMPDYVPLVQVLSTNRICSSVEEVIFLVNSNDRNTCLANNEYDFESMITSYNRRTGDLLDTIKQRYVRLRAFIIIQCSFNEFMSIERDKDALVSELSIIADKSDIKLVHDEDTWYNKWGSAAAAKTYPAMDGDGGHLRKYFDKYIIRMREASRNKDKEEFLKQRYSEVEKKFEAEWNKFLKIMKMWKALTKLTKKYGFTDGVEKIFKGGFEYMPLLECSLIGSYPNINKPKDMSTGTVYEVNCANVSQMSVKLTALLSNAFFEACSQLIDKDRLSLYIMLSGRSIPVIIPRGSENIANRLQSECNCRITGNNMLKSSASACWMICMCFLNRHNDDFDMSVVSEDYWKGVVSSDR